MNTIAKKDIMLIMEIIPDRFYTLTEFSKIMDAHNLPKSRITLKNYGKKGMVSFSKMGHNGRYYITGQEIKRFIDTLR